ncbi:hypothetical protein AzCIB_1332 [Azoarcus sp. CIB]|uniref:hypothetical protein n=1 Tax=Aromatoleum sp. (strain CIB) TaxID=198107 RepID=UPI00067AA53A|nr:hypothetical protein [Azoarcus sp. CIB]AKU11237.1 hypothetical protein AzCIB_1332 [Azoarcus sp. CIB]
MRIVFGRSESHQLPHVDMKIKRQNTFETSIELPWGAVISIDTTAYRPLASRLGAFGIDHRKTFEDLRKAVEMGSSALIEVQRGRRTSAASARKVIVKALFDSRRFVPREGPEYEITVPKAQVLEIDKKLYIPRWLARNRVRELFPETSCWPAIPGKGIWLEHERMWTEIFAPKLEQLRTEEEHAAAIRRQREETRTAERALADERVRLMMSEQKARINRLAEDHQKRLVQLPSVKAIKVQWKEWVKHRGTSHVVTHSADLATLYFSGTRIYIILPCGKEIIKSTSTVSYEVAPELEERSAVPA